MNLSVPALGAATGAPTPGDGNAGKGYGASGAPTHGDAPTTTTTTPKPDYPDLRKSGGGGIPVSATFRHV